MLLGLTQTFCIENMSRLLTIVVIVFMLQIDIALLAMNQSLPVITLSFLIRNKGYVLRHSLAYIERLTYPKSRINLFIRSDNNEDDSEELIRQWVGFWQDSYREVNTRYGEDCSLLRDDFIATAGNWTRNRQRRVTYHLSNALKYAQKQKSSYWMNIDADVLLTNDQTIQHLLNDFKKLTDAVVIAPLLDCPSRKDFSNFWFKMGKNFTFDTSYLNNGNLISNRTKVGLKEVDLVHTAYMVKLREGMAIHQLNDSKVQPQDGRYYPIIALQQMVKSLNSSNKVYIDNTEMFGYFPSPISHEYGLMFEEDVFTHLKLQIGAFKLANSLKLSQQELSNIQFRQPFLTSKVLSPLPKSESHRYGLSEAYVLNLKRRKERRNYMKYAFEELGIDGRLINAVDGKSLNLALLQLMNITQLNNYLDPSFKRPMTFGEVACFLSHYFVWKDMVKNKYDRVMVLEDDVRFSPIFNQGVWIALEEADYLVPDWDMIYLGRKLLRKNELKVPQSVILRYPKYSYWTIGYILTYNGAKKLLDPDPLKHMLPVDEYIPLMFDQHPNSNWSDQYRQRNLIALATDPSLIEPLFFKGEETYTSDTETSDLAF